MKAPTILQAFRAACVPGAKARVFAKWTGPDGQSRTVDELRSRDVVFLKEGGQRTYLTIPRAAEIVQLAPGRFQIANPEMGAGEVLVYAFEVTP